MTTCVQLGTSGTFDASCSGTLVIRFNDGVGFYGDNNTSNDATLTWDGTDHPMNGVDVVTVHVTKGNSYDYSCTGTFAADVGVNVFDADGTLLSGTRPTGPEVESAMFWCDLSQYEPLHQDWYRLAAKLRCKKPTHHDTSGCSDTPCSTWKAVRDGHIISHGKVDCCGSKKKPKKKKCRVAIYIGNENAITDDNFTVTSGSNVLATTVENDFTCVPTTCRGSLILPESMESQPRPTITGLGGSALDGGNLSFCDGQSIDLQYYFSKHLDNLKGTQTFHIQTAVNNNCGNFGRLRVYNIKHDNTLDTDTLLYNDFYDTNGSVNQDFTATPPCAAKPSTQDVVTDVTNTGKKKLTRYKKKKPDIPFA